MNSKKQISGLEKLGKYILEFLDKKYAELNLKRNLEIESGIMTMSTEMRSKLQEAKVIIEQLKWLKNLSENVLGAVEVLG